MLTLILSARNGLRILIKRINVIGKNAFVFSIITSNSIKIDKNY